MSKRLTREEFIYRCQKTHGSRYDYSKSVYKSKDTPVVIICPEHGEFIQSPKNHWNGQNCPACAGKTKRTTKDFIRDARKIHGNKYDYSKVDYRRNNIPVMIICPEHGPFMQRPSNHLNGANCKKCAAINRTNTNMKKYGSACVLATDEMKQYREELCMERHGCRNFMQAEETKETFKKTSMKHFGTDHPMKSDRMKKIMSEKCQLHTEEGRRKSLLSLQKHYHVSHPMHSDEIKKRQGDTMFFRHGVRHALQAEKFLIKSEDTIERHYGVRHPQQSLEIRERTIFTCVGKYGVPYPLLAPDTDAKRTETMMRKYGYRYMFESPEMQIKLQSAETKEKQYVTNIKRYGAKYPMQSEKIKRKALETKRRNHSFNDSKPEEELYKMLCSKFGVDDVVRQYYSEQYPFACDFYIKSKDCYVELNGTWGHGYRWFDENDPVCTQYLEKLKQKAKPGNYYGNVIYSWTYLDVRKRKTAAKSNLNYIVFWDCNLDDARLWFSKGCPDGQDWRKEYSWMEETEEGVLCRQN